MASSKIDLLNQLREFCRYMDYVRPYRKFNDPIDVRVAIFDIRGELTYHYYFRGVPYSLEPVDSRQVFFDRSLRVQVDALSKFDSALSCSDVQMFDFYDDPSDGRLHVSRVYRSGGYR
ncbi:hypothetical protein [Raoultibacter phocaeensis]|uniref:hypothetical protein n=1 Tax=Raoultibacter phocaeensis TaxID=2479841 RepID=UPI001119160F|nr:hypothetical protein [Raoultibacter phocaeensis]